MARKHQGRRKKRRKQQAAVEPVDVLNEARRLLGRGETRAALGFLKRLPVGDDAPPGAALLRFCAFTQRARELAQQGHQRESASMHARAEEHGRAVAPESLSEEELWAFLRHLKTAEAVTAYAAYLRGRSPHVAVERHLADRLMIHRCWDALAALDADHVLRKDADCVRQGLDAMDAGDWTHSSGLLRGLPRNSPFAPWRVFCKAMEAFDASDDAALRRALSLLLEDFVLAGTVVELKRAAGGGEKDGNARIQAALGTDSLIVPTLGKDLQVALLHDERPQRIADLMGRLADALCPDDPVPALVDLIQIAGLATARSGHSLRMVEVLAKRLLPPKRVPGVLARVRIALRQASLRNWDPAPAATLIGRLSAEFPAPGDQDLALSCILEDLARTGHRSGPLRRMPSSMKGTISKLLGGLPVNMATVYADLMEASLEADPDNREGYRFILEILGTRRENRNRRQDVLERMAAGFPEDAEPWLELAKLHYFSNAHRRAERSLAEARSRAPHDERILHMQAIGHLKSADISRNKGRFEIAAQDIERAAALRQGSLDTIVMTKRILLEIVSSGQDADEVAAPYLDQLSPDMQIRTLALLVHELEENSHVKNVMPSMTDSLRGLLQARTSLLDEVDGKDMAGLVAPLAGDLGILYKSLKVGTVLSRWWDRILNRAEGDRLLDVFDILMDCDGREAVRSEIGHRLAGAKAGERDRRLLLYLAVIRFQTGHDLGSRRFLDAVAGANVAERESLRACAARLARGTHGLLREALLSFDFDILEMDLGSLDMHDGLPDGDLPPGIARLLDFMDDDDAISELMEFNERVRDGLLPGEEFLDRLRASLRQLAQRDGRKHGASADDGSRELDLLDRLFDSCDYRGLPTPLIEVLSEALWTDPEFASLLELAAQKAKAAAVSGELSREARIFLFPKSLGRELPET